MTNLHENAQPLTGKQNAMLVIEKMQEAQVLRHALETEGSVLDNPYYVVGRQTPPGHWMDRQVELLRQERLATQDTNQQQGEQ